MNIFKNLKFSNDNSKFLNFPEYDTLGDRSKLMSADIFRQRGGRVKPPKKIWDIFCPSKVAQCVLSLSRRDILVSEGGGGSRGPKNSERPRTLILNSP